MTKSILKLQRETHYALLGTLMHCWVPSMHCRVPSMHCWVPRGANVGCYCSLGPKKTICLTNEKVYIFAWNLSFLGGLSLHLNHLIQSRIEISYRLFGTLPIGLLLSNLHSRQLETSPMTSYDQFWNMSTFGDSRAVRVIRQKKMPSENQFFLDEGATRLQWGLGVLGGQVPRLYGGTILGGGATHLGHPAGHLAQKFHFLDTFVAA